MKTVSLTAALLLCTVLSGCAGASKDETVQDQDMAYQQAMDAGSQALAIERYAVAEKAYREATRLALRRDDVGALGDASYNLAVTQLAADEPSDALQTVQNARTALIMRQGSEAHARTGGLPQSSHGAETVESGTGALSLVAAASAFRLNDLGNAAREARVATQSPDTDVALRGAFVQGLVAARQHDMATLTTAIGQIQSARRPQSAVQQGDLAELQASYALNGNPQQAMSHAADAVSLRRETGDYRAMARALALEAQAARQAGQGRRADALLAQAAQSLGARAGTDTDTDPLAAQYMREAGSMAPIQPFKVRETTP
ncbi:hypothetical protein [Acetobacter sp.]|jgi:tetratricopeptide (TPR) repeat protein|uniref:hypothetical protein n=1 Tax=Acetobacter sp. TaxID=440 RepID=UPI0025BAEFAF|nr:hypothetical protein [Acetobacter sp.]MCH4090441.1 hypothetical protein [Acetobacter sp.]MCI1299135.1 hypothetical protein [Acetobacter sp.]MCI1315682.1 hypothetical protein [Acetobacter sp.]